MIVFQALFRMISKGAKGLDKGRTTAVVVSLPRGAPAHRYSLPLLVYMSTGFTKAAFHPDHNFVVTWIRPG